MEKLLKILLLEDSHTDAEIIERLLRKEVGHCEFRLVMTKKSFLSALDEFIPDVILSDNSLPGFNGTEALKIARDWSLLVPFILITGTVSEEYAANIIKQGADDYILKDRMTRLPAAIESALRYHEIEKEKLATTEKLIQSEEKYRTIFFKSPLPKWVYDTETLGFLDVNEAAILHYGYTEAEFLKMTIKDIRRKEDVKDLLNNISKMQYEPGSRFGTWRHLKKNGEPIIVETTTHPIDYGSRKASMVIINDVTEKIKAEEHYRIMMERVSDAFVAIDKNWNYTYVNSRAGEIMGRKSASLLGKNIWTEFPEGIDRPFYEAYHKALKEQVYIYLEEYYPPYDAWLENHIYPSPEGLSIFFRNITERKKVEAELSKLEQEKLENKIEEQKKISRAILVAQEKERNAIGIELHDNVNQILVGADLVLSMTRSNPENIQELINISMGYLQEAIQENRKIAHILVTPDLKTENLVGLLKKLTTSMLVASNIKVSLDTGKFNEDLLDTERKFNIYRIVQEQCTNIVKYAKATTIHFILVTNDESFTMSVADNGIGMDTGKKSAGIGIRNIRDRLGLFNGSANIVTAPGKGFTLKITIPLF